MRVLVCGGRDYRDSGNVYAVLDALHAQTPVTCLIHGGASGADSLGQLWAEHRGVPQAHFPADWNAHGRSAGPIRNKQMLVEGKPDLVVAFPGGAGTTNMIGQAERAGVEVRRA